MRDTPLKAEHDALGASFTDFAGWNMPVRYTSITEEHSAVRERVGLFDLCHMGRLTLKGGAAALDALVPTDVPALATGQAKYSFFLTPQGTFIDDILIYAREDDHFLVVNASNREPVLAHLAEHYQGEVIDQTEELAMIAVQGPQAMGLIDELSAGKPSDLDYYSFGPETVCGVEMAVARTGYTGEDGVELYLPVAEAGKVWGGLMEAGAGRGVTACGLGARDTLRLEAGMALYGHEIDLETNPVEARLNWAVAWKKEADYIGKAAITQIKADGPTRRMVGLVLPEARRVPRQGQTIHAGDEVVGKTTSGTASPTLGERIAIGYVRKGLTKPGTELEVDIRGNRERAKVVKLPFYKRAN